MPDDRSYWDLLEPHWGNLETYGSAEEFLASAAIFPRPIVLLYAAHFCQSEICNGGFLQFFWNSTGVLGPEAVEGFQVIGMHLTANVLGEAISKLRKPYPREREERQDALLEASLKTPEELHEIFSTVTKLFLAYREATARIGFDDLDRRFWKLLREESGGFESAADAYALAIEPTLVWPSPSPNPTQSE